MKVNKSKYENKFKVNMKVNKKKKKSTFPNHRKYEIKQ